MTKIITAVSLSLLAALNAQADTLWSIYEQALRNDPAIMEAEATMMAEMEAKPQARALWLPQLNFTAGYNYGTGEGQTVVAGRPAPAQDTDISSTNWGVNLSQSILDTASWRGLKKADKQVARSAIDYQVAQQDLMIRVSEAYFNVLAAQDTLASERAAKDAIGRQLEQAQRRFEVGLIAITDVKEAQAGYDDATATEIAAQRALATAKEGLREITGEYPQTLANPGENLPLIPPDPQIEQDWVDVSLEQNLALESAKLGADITRENIAIAKGDHWPTIDLSASYADNDADLTNNLDSTTTNLTNTQSSVAVNLNFPIYSGGAVSSRVQQEVYLHRAARENYERVARQTERETRDAYLGVIAEIARVQALARSEDSNQTALEATEAGYEVGTRTTVDVLLARQSLFLAQTQYARSKYDYLINVLKLKRAAGTLQSVDIKEVDEMLVVQETLPDTPGRGSAPNILLESGTPTSGGFTKELQDDEPSATEPGSDENLIQ